jgi:hypothetical protein
MNTEVNRLLKEPDVQKDLANLDVAIMGGSARGFPRLSHERTQAVVGAHRQARSEARMKGHYTCPGREKLVSQKSDLQDLRAPL